MALTRCLRSLILFSAMLAACTTGSAFESRAPRPDGPDRAGNLPPAGAAGGTTRAADRRPPPPTRPASAGAAPARTTSATPAAVDLDGVPHSVPLAAIVFDTFQANNRAVPLPTMTAERIDLLRDAIPPISQPKYVAAAAGDWLRDTDLVIGYIAADGIPYAFPTKILNFHEIVNTELAGQPVVVTYCPLCASALVFDRRVAGRTLTFGNTSALYESAMVMVDIETDSYWYQVGGEAIFGELTGARLTLLPATTSIWREWLLAHPDTRVLSRDTGYRSNYDAYAFYAYARRLDEGGFLFPVSDAALDARLKPATVVLTVALDGEALAFPLVQLGAAATHVTLGGQALVVFSLPFGPTGAAFRPELDGQRLTFDYTGDVWRDRESGSTWSVDGRALAGPLAGAQLQRVPASYLFWFAAAASTPGIQVYSRN